MSYLSEKRITLRLDDELYTNLHELVEQGEYPSDSEAIRDAVRALIDKKVRKLTAELKLREKYGI